MVYIIKIKIIKYEKENKIISKINCINSLSSHFSSLVMLTDTWKITFWAGNYGGKTISLTNIPEKIAILPLLDSIWFILIRFDAAWFECQSKMCQLLVKILFKKTVRHCSLVKNV